MSGRKATAIWKGGLKDGEGELSLGSGTFKGKYSFDTRFGEGSGTNPEELLGAALAACYAMAFNAQLERESTPATSIEAEATVYLGKDDVGFKVNRIDLETRGSVDGIDQAKFAEIAEKVHETCIVSRALASTEINLTATLN